MENFGKLLVVIGVVVVVAGGVIWLLGRLFGSQSLPGTLRLEVACAQPGLEATYDLVLYSEFADRAALDAYQNHPTHVAVKPFLRAVVSERQCMDYEV